MRRTKERRIANLKDLTCYAHPGTQEVGMHLGTMMALMIRM
jgi:hypothetical protein